MASPEVAPPFFGPLQRRANYTCKPDGGFFPYTHYRQNYRHEIAEDCLLRCVYCDSHEDEIGGREAMELDHFRPYTRDGFEHLEHDPHNLHHACGRCNRLKSNKWPCARPPQSHDGVVGFIDPFAETRSAYFEVADSGELISLQNPAPYLIRVLALNRPLLKLLRRRRIYEMELNRYAAQNLPRWEAARVGQGDMTLEELARDFGQYRHLHQLATIPLARPASAPRP